MAKHPCAIDLLTLQGCLSVTLIVLEYLPLIALAAHSNSAVSIRSC